MKRKLLKDIVEIKNPENLVDQIQLWRNMNVPYEEIEWIRLHEKDVNRLIQLFEEKQLDSAAAKEWADFVEMHPNVGYDNNMATVLFWLSSPELNGEFGDSLIEEIKNLFVSKKD